MAKFYAEVEFDFIGYRKDVPKMSVATNKLDNIVEDLDVLFRNYRYDPTNIGYVWFTDVFGNCFATVLSTGGVIAKFRINTKRRHKIGGQ